MVRRESARSVQQGCFLREWRSPFVQGTVKRRRCAVPAAAMHLANLHWQAKCRATRQALSQAMPWALLGANSRTRVKLFVQQLAKPPLLEPQD
jgi:hypothetical protein